MVAFSRDGRLLASASVLQRVDIGAVDPVGIRPLSTIALPGPSNISADDGDFSPSTGELALALKSRDIKTYSMTDPTRPTLTADYTDFGSYVNGVAYSADGTHLVGSSSDDTARVYDLVNGTPPQALRVGNTVSQAAFAGNRVVTSSQDGTVAVWPPGQYSVRAGPLATFQFSFQPAGPRFVVSNADANGSFSQWRIDPALGLQRAGPNVSAPSGTGFTSIDMTGDASLVAAGTIDGRMFLADVSDPTRPAVISPPVDLTPGRLIETVAISGRSRLAVGGSSLSSTLPVVDVSDPRVPRRLGTVDLGDGVAWASMAPNGRMAVVSTANGFVGLVDLSVPSRPRLASRIKLFESGALASRFSPDGKRLVVSSGDSQVELLDISDPANPRRLAGLGGPTGSVYGATFSRDGTRVAAGGADGRLWIWDVRDPARSTATARLQAFPGRIYDVQFGPDDQEVLATGAAGVVGSWRTDVDDVIASACRLDTDPVSREEWSQYVPGLAYQPPCR